MNLFFKFYNMHGNTKGQGFSRFMILILTIGLISMLIINLGYKDGKWYWKPADISIKKD